MAFAMETCKQYGLSEDQTTSLSVMIEKMCKFCGSEVEGEDITVAQVRSSRSISFL